MSTTVAVEGGWHVGGASSATAYLGDPTGATHTACLHYQKRLPNAQHGPAPTAAAADMGCTVQWVGTWGLVDKEGGRLGEPCKRAAWCSGTLRGDGPVTGLSVGAVRRGGADDEVATRGAHFAVSVAPRGVVKPVPRGSSWPFIFSLLPGSYRPQLCRSIATADAWTRLPHTKSS